MTWEGFWFETKNTNRKKQNKIRTYLIEDDDIVEIHTSINEEQVPPGKLGDIYIGKVQNIVQNIGAAFIEITKGVNCILILKDAKTHILPINPGKNHFVSAMNLSYRSAGKR